LKLRIFSDDAGKMNRSVTGCRRRLARSSAVHAGGRYLGRQPPELHGRGAGAAGARLYERRCCSWLASATRRWPAGEFGADMRVALVNDGPVTIPLRIL
jgi:D-tyrosyl-tRNA(Tyr) deacylase